MKTNILPPVNVLVLLASLLAAGCDSPGGSFHERHMDRLEESKKLGSISGGESFLASKSYDSAYDTILTFLKRKDLLIDSSDKNAGQITTGYQIAGGWHQTGTRIRIVLIKETDATTTVKVAVTEQTRYKALQVEPWDDPTVNAAKSTALAEEIKAAL